MRVTPRTAIISVLGLAAAAFLVLYVLPYVLLAREADEAKKFCSSIPSTANLAELSRMAVAFPGRPVRVYEYEGGNARARIGRCSCVVHITPTGTKVIGELLCNM